MRTSYRDIFLLACCQALLLTNGAGLITMNGLVGYALTDTKELATLGVTLYVLGSAVATMPASLLMARIGRRKGFMLGALINVAGCALAVLALSRGSFVLYCVATGVIGIYNAIGLQYRFAAAEVAAPADKAKAISLVLAGGVVGGFLGPESARRAVDLFATPFLGGFVALAFFALVALVVQSFVHVPPPTPEERSGKGRPLSVTLRQPVFVVAVLAGAVGYGLNGVTVTHFLVALALLGVGWNFMYTGGTTLLTESYAPGEKARAQGANDFIVFATMGVSSLASGAMVSTAGWEAMNRAMLPVLAAIAVVVVWFAWRRRAPRPAHPA